MDSLKLQLYLHARARVQQGNNIFCCWALEKALSDFGLISKAGSRLSLLELRQEFFPEFFSLYDGSYWDKEGGNYSQCPEDSAWWDSRWIEPRLRALDIAISRAGG